MSADKAVTFSAREMEVLALAWQCMEQPPKVDMNKLASLTGYTPGSASVTFGNIKRKIKLLGERLAADGPATPKKAGGPGRGKAGTTPKSTGKRGAGKTIDDSESPTKRAKKGRAKKRNDDDDDDEELFTPKVKKEELADITSGANDFYDQLHNASGYDFGQPNNDVN